MCLSKNEDCWYKDVCPVECTSTCIKFAEMKHLMDSSGIPIAKQKSIALTPYKCDMNAFIHLDEIRKNIVEFVESGKNLYIMGSIPGNGKTTWSIKLMLRYFDRIWAGNGLKTRGLFIHVPTFLLKCKDFNSQDTQFEQLKSDILKADLVIWDDIASTSVSAYDYSQLLMYLDTRCLTEKSNIYTGNITDRDSMAHALGAKLTSRIWSMNTDIVEIIGGDRR